MARFIRDRLRRGEILIDARRISQVRSVTGS
jgi:hypothetical protein